MVGGTHGVLVVLHHQHRVAQVPQALERRDQPLVVSLVQPDRRLVEDVEHPHERRADLRGQTDALRLATGQRRSGALDAEVADANVLQKAEPLFDLAQNQVRDPAVMLGKVQIADPGERAPRRERGELMQRQIRHQHRA